MRTAKLGPMLRTFWKVHRLALRTTCGEIPVVELRPEASEAP
jgi:hypothetical protein